MNILNAPRIVHTQALADRYKRDCAAEGASIVFPAGPALSLLETHGKEISDERDRAAFAGTVAEVMKVLVQVCTTVVVKSSGGRLTTAAHGRVQFVVDFNL